jgi:AraC-like DNA-binding protein
MLYLERIPAAPLNSFVRSLWYTNAPHVGHGRERILPTGRTQIILNLARDFLLDCPQDQCARPMPPSVVVGARSVFEIVDTSDMADLIGIVFHPGGLAPLASEAADLFSNRSLPLEDAWGTPARVLRDRLRELSTPQDRLNCLEQFLLTYFAHRLACLRRREVDFALSRFARSPGISSVGETARQIGWSERHFSQVFREQVGFTPKVWCRIQRFQRAVGQLHAGVDVRWAELALECGYYDQSHFANEFRAFSGVDATTYSARRTLWTNHITAD